MRPDPFSPYGPQRAAGGVVSASPQRSDREWGGARIRRGLNIALHQARLAKTSRPRLGSRVGEDIPVAGTKRVLANGTARAGRRQYPQLLIAETPALLMAVPTLAKARYSAVLDPIPWPGQRLISGGL